MSITKTQLKKQTTKEIINLLIEEFDAYNINREAQYIEFWADIDGFEIDMQMDTRDYSVSSWDSIKLVGDGWRKEEINKQVAAAILEERINQSIEIKYSKELVDAGFRKPDLNKQVATTILQERINESIEKKLGR